jgi:hypothetical protein
MASSTQTIVDALSAPADDGKTLLWPREPSWIALVEANRRLRQSYAFEILDKTFADLRHDELRGPPIIMAGHQPVFIHPGVWAKNIVASKLAATMGGQARFLIVDSDAAPRLAMIWPETTDDYCRTVGAPGPSWLPGRSYEQLPAVPAAAWRDFFDGLPEQWRSDASSALPTFLGVFLNGSPGPDYVTRWISGVAAVERLLGLASPRCIRDSQVWSNQPGLTDAAALCFSVHILLHADEFLASYNAALAAYRDRRGIRGRQHPIPDLVREGDRAEMPFWMLRSSQPRGRLFVSRAGSDGTQLWVGSDPICRLSRGELAKTPVETLRGCLGEWRIRPRALALTMFARLFACDLFIHGIGGAKYDQITDDIIRRFFHVEPPAYACASATCRLPLRTYDVTDADRATWSRRLRDLSHNPQRYLADGETNPTAAALIAERDLAIAESDRLRREEPRSHAARKAVFARIRRANAALVQLMPDATDQTRHRLAEIESRLEHNKVAAGREWFFALYPTANLLGLRDAFTSLF